MNTRTDCNMIINFIHFNCQWFHVIANRKNNKCVKVMRSSLTNKKLLQYIWQIPEVKKVK